MMQPQTSYAEVLKLVNPPPRRDKVRLIGPIAPQILALPHGIPGQQRFKFTGTRSPELAEEMSDVVDVACAQVDEREW